MIELIIFDCDGVLIDSEVLACKAVSAVLNEEGLDIPWQVVAERYTGMNDADMAKRIDREYGSSLPEDFALLVAERAMALFEGQLEAIPGTADLLSALALPFCVASNSKLKRLSHSLAQAGLGHYFPEDRTFSADHVPRAKPAPDLHLFAAERMGFQAHRALVIEDSKTGVSAARAAGMEVIGFTGASHPAASAAELQEEGAKHCVASMAELRVLINEEGWFSSRA